MAEDQRKRKRIAVPGTWEFRGNHVREHGRGHFGNVHGDSIIYENHNHHHHHHHQKLNKSPGTRISGAEVAGSVFGLFPIVSSGLDQYIEAVSIVRNGSRAKKLFQRIKRTLGMDHAALKNHVQNLLKDGMDDLSLLQSPHDASDQQRWEDPGIDRLLRQKLGRRYETFSQAMSCADETLEEIRECFGIDDDGEVSFSLEENSVTQTLNSLKFGLKRDAYDSFLATIQDTTDRIQDITGSSEIIEPVRQRKKAPNFDRSRTYATRLFAMLRVSFTISCSVEHRASLYLGPPLQGSWRMKRPDPDLLRLRIILHHGLPNIQMPLTWTIKETEIEPLEDHVEPDVPERPPNRKVRFELPPALLSSGPSMAHPSSCTFSAQSTPKRESQGQQGQYQLEEIRDLCKSFQDLREAQDSCRSCLGYFLDELDRCRHGLFWPENTVVDHATANEITLADALKSKKRYSLTLLDRRRLALALANGMLQLYDTPWLGTQWGKNDVVLFANAGKLEPIGPFISAAMASEQISKAARKHFTACQSIKNETIFALGIVLIELAFNKPFEKLKIPEDSTEGPFHVDFNAANRLIKKVETKFGAPYASVVRRCVWCEFDHNDSCLTDRELQKKFFSGVVVVLQEEVTYLEKMVPVEHVEKGDRDSSNRCLE